MTAARDTPDSSGTRSLFDPPRNCGAVVNAGRAAVLIDAEAYFRRFAQAAEQAERTIIILGWDFDSRTPLCQPPEQGMPGHLGDFLNALARRKRRLRIHVLNWDYPLLFATDRETRPLYGLSWKPARHVRLRYDNTQPVGGSHHQKIVVIDDAIAFNGGLDLASRRWDTCDHKACDERRTVDGKPYPPFHDVMLAVDGEAARALGRVARERWRNATGETIPGVLPPYEADRWPADLEPTFRDVTVALARTVPPTPVTTEVREIEALYVDMIARARRSIYIENQYFTSDRVGTALAARLAEPDPPEIVLVTRLLSHGWLEENTMTVLRKRLVKLVRDADRGGRFEAYYPHVPNLADGTCVDVHAKLIVVDDEWLRVGSANLSNRSMGLDTECDLVVEAHGRADVAEAIAGVRTRLLAEHLGVEPDAVGAAIVAAGGSLHDAIRQLRCDGRSLRVLEADEAPAGIALDLATVADPERPVAVDLMVQEFAPDLSSPRRPAWRVLAAVAALALLLALAWRYTPLADLLTAERITAAARASHDLAWLPFAIVAVYAFGGFVMFPRPLVTLFAVMAYGPVLGGLLALVGIVAATIVAYSAGRALPRDTIRRVAGDRLNTISQLLRRGGLLAVLGVSIVPTAPFVVVGIIAGAVRVRPWQYILGSVIGHAPGVLAATVFGHQLMTALRNPGEVSYALIAGAVATFAVVVGLARRWFRRHGGVDAAAGLPA